MSAGPRQNRDALDLKTCKAIVEELKEIKSACASNKYKILEGLAHLELARTHLLLDSIDQHSKTNSTSNQRLSQMDNALKL